MGIDPKGRSKEFGLGRYSGSIFWIAGSRNHARPVIASRPLDNRAWNAQWRRDNRTSAECQARFPRGGETAPMGAPHSRRLTLSPRRARGGWSIFHSPWPSVRVGCEHDNPAAGPRLARGRPAAGPPKGPAAGLRAPAAKGAGECGIGTYFVRAGAGGDRRAVVRRGVHHRQSVRVPPRVHGGFRRERTNRLHGDGRN